MITQDARGRCQGVWGSQPPARGPKGFHLGPKGGRQGPRTKHMLKHTCHRPTPSPTSGEGNKYTQTWSTPKCTHEGPEGVSSSHHRLRSKKCHLHTTLRVPYAGLGARGQGRGWLSVPHLVRDSFMLNRGGATLIPTSSKTEQARRDRQAPSWPQAKGNTVLCWVC